MRILWVIDLEYEYGARHGANLRFFSLSRELIAKGHDVYFVTSRRPTDDAGEKQRYLDQLIEQQVISGHLELTYLPPTGLRRFGQLAVYPGLQNRILRRFQEPPRALVEEFMAERGINLCVVTSRLLLFLVPAIGRTRPVFIDWIDSGGLFWLRQAGMNLRQRRFASMPYILQRLTEACSEESYYGRRCHLNLTVSPADKRFLDTVNRRPQRTRVLLNGVAIRGPKDITPIPNRLIISGNMCFPPNSEGAIWFIDHVLPLVLRHRPDTVLVIAGADPPAELRARHSAHVRVTGFVDDLEREIVASALCVAPLLTGSGFKNKVVEAIGANRYLVATSRAVEFLDPGVRSRLLVTDTPQGMAAHILAYLENPSAYAPALRTLRRILAEEFTWEHRAEEFLGFARDFVSPGAVQGGGASAPAWEHEPSV